MATLLLVVIGSGWSSGRSSNGTPAGPVRTVTIPVTVTNKSGEPVSELTASSFSLWQGGRKQTLESVAEVAPITVGQRKTKVAFVVVDQLDRTQEVLKECFQLLADAVINDSPVSLSEIDDDGLHVVHEVSTANSILASALLQLDTEHPFLAHRDPLKAMEATAPDKSLVVEEADRLRHFGQGTLGTPLHGSGLQHGIEGQLVELRGLQEMATALEHAHGRKTVLWLAGRFQTDVNEAEDSVNVGSTGITNNYYDWKSLTFQYQKTIDMLNDAQISVFPVHSPLLPPKYDLDFEQTRNALRRLAQDTGGEWMEYSDTLSNIVKRAEDKSTVYHLLTFQPEVPKNRQKWTTLKVNVSEQSLKVQAPSGLFVFPPPQ
jgi:VWFA-related protein